MIEINTIHWFPKYIAEMDEFKEIAKAYDYLLEQAFKNLGKVYDNQFIESLDADGCSMHERTLGISPNVSDSVSDRRRRIMGYYASDLPYTENKLKSILTAMCGKDGFEVIVNGAIYQVDIQIKLNSLNLVNNVSEIARKIIPANMTVNVNIIYNVYQRFIEFTHGELQNYTHLQMKMDKVFQNKYNFHGSLGRFKNLALQSYTHLQMLTEENIGG